MFKISKEMLDYPAYYCLCRYPELRMEYYARITVLGKAIINVERRLGIKRKNISLASVESPKLHIPGVDSKEINRFEKEYTKYRWSCRQLSDFEERVAVLKKIKF